MDEKFDEDKEFTIWKERSIHGLTLTWEEYRAVRKEAISHRRKRLYLQNKTAVGTKKRSVKKAAKKKRTTKQKGGTINTSSDGGVSGEEEDDKPRWSFMTWNKTAEKFSKQWRPSY
jgi:hypothetical protein